MGISFKESVMKIAIDVSPLSSGHRIRGVGFYLTHILQAFKKYYPQHQYLEFTQNPPEEYDVIHYPYFDPFFLTLPVFGKSRTVVTVHDLTPLVLPNIFPIGLRGKVAWAIQKSALKRAKRIITDSISSKKDVEKLTGISASKINSVYLAAGDQFKKLEDAEKKSKIKTKYKLPNVFALYVGDATPNKNLPNLVKAILRTQIPLIMVGKSLVDVSIDLSNVWTKDIKIVRELQTQHASQIRLLGFVPDEDLVQLYNLATVLVMPSIYEGFGLPVIEAFACGCPVISSNKGSLGEIIGNAAFTVDPHNIESISDAIQKLVGDKKLAKQLSQAGIQQSKEFSWKKTASETLKTYQYALQ